MGNSSSGIIEASIMNIEMSERKISQTLQNLFKSNFVKLK